MTRREPLSDPFSNKDPFAPTLPPDPWGGGSSVAPPIIGFSSDSTAVPTSRYLKILVNSCNLSSYSTWTSFSPTTTSMPDPFTPLPALGGGVANGGGASMVPLSFDLSAFSVPLEDILSISSSTDKVCTTNSCVINCSIEHHIFVLTALLLSVN